MYEFLRTHSLPTKKGFFEGGFPLPLENSISDNFIRKSHLRHSIKVYLIEILVLSKQQSSLFSKSFLLPFFFFSKGFLIENKHMSVELVNFCGEGRGKIKRKLR